LTSSHLPLPLRPRPRALATRTDIHLVPALIAAAGKQADWSYINFFTANIRNANTRRAYTRTCQTFSLV